MPKIKLILVSCLVLAIGMAVTIVSPVSAHAVQSEEDAAESYKQTESQRKANVEAKRQQAAKELKTKQTENKATRDTKKAETRQRVCEARQKGLATKFKSLATNSERLHNHIGGFLDKALAYEARNNLNPANFDNLVAAAEKAKDVSSASIQALKDTTPTVDCTRATLSADISAFRTAAATARDDLKDYRGAVKAVLASLRDAKASEGSN